MGEEGGWMSSLCGILFLIFQFLVLQKIMFGKDSCLVFKLLIILDNFGEKILEFWNCFLLEFTWYTWPFIIRILHLASNSHLGPASTLRKKSQIWNSDFFQLFGTHVGPTRGVHSLNKSMLDVPLHVAFLSCFSFFSFFLFPSLSCFPCFLDILSFLDFNLRFQI